MIKKTKIIEGVYFIEIPEANLYIQCGSPAESVKHLIKGGFISKTSKDGVEFETGPNAILLSDVMIQNGEFSNMSEFPVLQMLYKQGLIIPNHPNNTGLKPLLIGHENQVLSQMQYIYRGNYGLISQEEIESCGIDSMLAKELYNMKLKFAFGKLQAPSNLLESRFVDSTKCEIRDGVFIKRVAINIFEISYKDDSIIVDLNLTDKKNYISPYLLPQFKLKREYFSIIHSGQGDGWDMVRPSMNSIICFQGKYYLVDVVPNINYILDSLSISINEIEGVFITHCHDDHIAGITTLIRSDKKIKIYGAKIVTKSLIKKLSALLVLEESDFQNLLDIKNLDIETWNNVDNLEVKPIISPHPVETTIYLFRTFFEERYYSYGHFADIIDTKVLKEMIVENTNQVGITQSFYNKIIKEYTQAVDIKKVDIGGGMIHGNYKDFIDDHSGKIILGHTNQVLTKEQLKVGVNSLFGLQDVLIGTKLNYEYKILSRYLKSNFPLFCHNDLEGFLNCEIIDFNPKELLYKRNEKITNLYLIIDGFVEKNSPRCNDIVVLESGVIIGEKSALNERVIDAVFIAKNYVKALKIPIDYFIYFVDKHNLYSHFKSKFELGKIFLTNNIFSENISYPTINKLIKYMTIIEVEEKSYKFDEDLVYLVVKGSMNILVNDFVLDKVSMGGHFGGLHVLLNIPSIFKYIPAEKSVLYSVPSFLIHEIPVAFWKIFEYYGVLQKKLINFSVYNNDPSTFLWNRVYCVNIDEMDKQHKKQLEYFNEITNCITNSFENDIIIETLDNLYEFSKKHFYEEENLMKKYNFYDYENHKNIHQGLLQKMLVFKQEFIKGTLDKSFLAVTLKEWLLQHILEEDIKYGRFLNSKGVY